MALPVELWPHIGGGGGNRTRVRRAFANRVYKLSLLVNFSSIAQVSPTILPSTHNRHSLAGGALLKNRCTFLRSCKPMQLQLTERLPKQLELN